MRCDAIINKFSLGFMTLQKLFNSFQTLVFFWAF